MTVCSKSLTNASLSAALDMSKLSFMLLTSCRTACSRMLLAFLLSSCWLSLIISSLDSLMAVMESVSSLTLLDSVFDSLLVEYGDKERRALKNVLHCCVC